MRFKGLFFFLFIFFLRSQAQEITCISNGNGSDSSFYSIARINENEYWLCGETGILKRLDTLGHLQNIGIPEYHGHLLKVLRWNDYIFLSSDEGTMYRYHQKDRTWLVKQFRGFEERCFYDFLIDADGRLMICGGAKGIAKGKKKIPHGFILRSDTGFTCSVIMRKRIDEFYFLIRADASGKAHLLSFNGYWSKIYESKDLRKWKRREKIKGLVHDMIHFDDTVFYCGASDIRYKESGLFFSSPSAAGKQIIPDIGCIWRMQKHRGILFGISRSGGLLEVERQSLKLSRRTLPVNFSIYAFAFTPGGKCILAGNGKRIYMMDLEKQRD